ncbi:hypothetical protein DAPPUDRAFT_324624 [Daphnia pulex]|uniref:Uncharacterized protein n=1 Tax=Daphnia pulex TaxID=6669 RepID=E9H295_DAPPU|nr:hypothetical protein DAPPUDRAFT_324624 [Daphnia pulex]|eukprot:EFX74131.1 hypothetical protein DAPPUDRAFT_324624 [Daphnia pulex]
MIVMRSCCCCSPRTGCLLIAVLYMLFTGLLLLGLGLILAHFNNSVKPVVVVIMQDVPADGAASSGVATATEFSITTMRNIIIVSIILNCLYFALCLLLFVGGVKECSCYLIPWIVAEFIRQLLFLAAFVFLAWCFSILVKKREIDYGTLLLVCVLMLVVIAITFYFWLAIVAAMQEYRAREKQVSPEEVKHAFPLSDISLIND